MMPYSTGFAGVLAQQACGAPLVFNLDDSPTCLDQNPTFASRLHYAATRWMEDLYVRRADAVAYVSRDNLKRVRAVGPNRPIEAPPHSLRRHFNASCPDATSHRPAARLRNV